MLLRRVEGVGDRRLGGLRLPLLGPGRALGQLPFVFEEIVEVVVAPLRRRLRPGHLRATGDGVRADARAVLALPAEALFLDGAALRLGAEERRIAGAMGLAEGVAAGDERHRLLVVHRHAREGLADVVRGRNRIRVAVRPLRIDVDQAHLHRAERLAQLALTAVALVAEPSTLRAPIELFRLPGIGAAAAEAEGLEAHRFERDVAGEDVQVGPGKLVAVFLLDRPEQPARLVEVGIVRPAVERREALLATAGTATAVGDAVGARTVPRHANEQAAVMAEVGRPPVLGIRHQGMQVLNDGIQVEALEFLGIVERLAHRVGQGGVLVKDLKVQLVRPPVTIRVRAGPAREGALAFVWHVSSDRIPVFRFEFRCHSSFKGDPTSWARMHRLTLRVTLCPRSRDWPSPRQYPRWIKELAPSVPRRVTTDQTAGWA